MGSLRNRLDSLSISTASFSTWSHFGIRQFISGCLDLTDTSIQNTLVLVREPQLGKIIFISDAVDESFKTA
jgi:hypothetical protein